MTKSKTSSMTRTAAARIQSSGAKRNGGGVRANSFAARAQRSASGGSKKSK